MAINVIKNLDRVAIVEEVTEGTAIDDSANTDMIEPLADSVTLDITKEEIERNLLSDTVESEASRVGLPSVSSEIGVELRANSTAGSAPIDYDVLMKSLLGGKRQISSAQTSGSSHTSTVINFADTSAFNVGDIVLVKESGAYECRPISEVTTNTSITFPFALTNGAPSDAVEIEKVTVYYPDSTSEVTYTKTHYIGNTVKHQGAGLRAVSGSVSDWTTGKTPKMNFSSTGLSLTKADGGSSYSPVANTALPPSILSACAWINGTMVDYNEFSLSIEKEVAEAPSACQSTGKLSSRTTGMKVTGKIDPYTEDDDVDRFDLFDDNTDTSFFTYAYNSSATAGEFSEVVAIWIPQAKIISIPLKDQSGIYADDIEFRAHRSSGNDSVFIATI